MQGGEEVEYTGRVRRERMETGVRRMCYRLGVEEGEREGGRKREGEGEDKVGEEEEKEREMREGGGAEGREGKEYLERFLHPLE